MNEEDFDDGRIPLPDPSKEDLNASALLILEGVDEVQFEDGAKIFKGQGRLWIQAPGEEAGEMIEAAPHDLKERIIWEASKIRGERIREAGAKYLDPATNPLIRVDGEVGKD